MKALKRVLNVVKRQRCTDPQNIDLDEVCRLLGGYYRCSADEGYPFLSYYRTRSYSSNNSSFLFYLEVISYH